MPRIYYHLSKYISHRQAGEDYIAALKSVGIPIVPAPEDADVLLLHDDPLALAEIIPRYRDKYIIAYSVWETEQLPWQYREALQGVQRIWTCSPFSEAAFAQAGFRVNVVPHIVFKALPSADDCDCIKQLVAYEQDIYYFYTIADSVNPRKNLDTLLKIFISVFAKNEKIKLVVKQYRKSWDIASLPNVISIDDFLSRGQIGALHTMLDCYVSTHHTEAWGLSLSDAMTFENPVIATGFSGNMFYMNAENSFPVQFERVPISKKMCDLVPFYTQGMHWADVDQNHFKYLMRKVWMKKYSPDIVSAASQDMQQFRLDAIGLHMKKLLDAI